MDQSSKCLRAGRPGLCAAALLGLLLAATGASAAEYEVRMPVEKTVRLASPEEAQEGGKAAEGSRSERKSEAKAAKAVKEAKPEPAKAEAPAKAAPKAASKPAPKPEKSSTPAEKSAKPEAPAKAAAPQEKPVAKPQPVAPMPEPMALELPPAGVMQGPAGGLPAEGQWVGEVRAEFTPDSLVLKVATSGPVERVTWFNVAQPGSPRKLATDLRGPWRKRGAFVLHFDTGPVKAIVVGEHPDRLRLSTEFRDGVVKRELDPVIVSGPEGVTLTIPLSVRLGR